MRVNHASQIQTLKSALPMIEPGGGRVVFVTSHMAHYYGSRPVYPGYEPVAESKRAGKDSLQAMVPELERRDITLLVSIRRPARKHDKAKAIVSVQPRAHRGQTETVRITADRR